MSIKLDQLELKATKMKIRGTSPLICHKWSEKAKRGMLEKQMGKNKVKARAKKDPKGDYEDSLYKLQGGGFGFPAVAFKAAMVRAAKSIDGLTMTDARQMFRILADDGDLVKINGEPSMREDMVRIQQTTDIRYRGEFREWSADLSFHYNAAVISLETLAALIQLAGFSVGVGEWRPEKSGTYGTFEIASA